MKTNNISNATGEILLAFVVLILFIAGAYCLIFFTKSSSNQMLKDEVLFRTSLETGCKNPILTNFNDKFVIAEVDACGVKVIYEYNYATKNMTRISK